MTSPLKLTTTLLPPSSLFTSASQLLVTAMLHTSKLPSTKSFSCAVSERDERVSARKLLKHGVAPPSSRVTLIPPSKKLSFGMSAVGPLLGV
ncbi:hypothetical protein D3C84_1147860 [compost metagenome]